MKSCHCHKFILIALKTGHLSLMRLHFQINIYLFSFPFRTDQTIYSLSFPPEASRNASAAEIVYSSVDGENGKVLICLKKSVVERKIFTDNEI